MNGKNVSWLGSHVMDIAHKEIGPVAFASASVAMILAMLLFFSVLSCSLSEPLAAVGSESKADSFTRNENVVVQMPFFHELMPF
jgi:hypothetical protein